MLSPCQDEAARLPKPAETKVPLPEILVRRMLALDLDPDAVIRAEPRLVRELAARCAGCASRDRCTGDLGRASSDRAWRGYCPVAVLLEALTDEWWLHERI